MVGLIQRSSDPSQPGRAMDKKNQKFHNFYMFIITKFGKNFEEKIDICFFLKFWKKKWKLKSLTNSRDFHPDPKLKSSVFWMN